MGEGSRRKVPILPPGYLLATRPCGADSRAVIKDPSGRLWQSLPEAQREIMQRHISFGGQQRLDERRLQEANRLVRARCNP